MFVGYRPLVLAAAAAVLLVASMSVIQYVRPWGAPAPEYREAPGNVIVALPDSAQLPRDACRLRWSAAPAGARYTVRVAAEDLTTVARATDLETPEYVVPVSALSQIPTGGRIVWQVDATLPDGRVIASPTFVTTLK
jgi:hypothetical protein